MKKSRLLIAMMYIVIIVITIFSMFSCASKKDTSENEAIEAMISSLEYKLSELADKNEADLTKLKNEYELKFEELRRINNEYTKELETLEEEYVVKTSKLESDSKKNANAITELTAQYLSDLATLNQADIVNADAVKALEESYNAKITALEEADQVISKELDSLKSNYEAKVVEINGKIAENDVKIQQTKDELQNGIEVLVAKHNLETSAINSLITELQTSDTANKERLSYLEAKVAELLYTHKYTVSFNVNGGAESYADQTIEEGKKASKPIDPTRDGYVFLGWYAGDELWSFAGHTVTENIALTAKWDTVAVYQLAYDKTHYIVTGLKYDDIENVSILDKYNDLPVLTIKDEAFKDCVNMKSIIVPNTITSIGSAAFNGCYSLEQMEIPFAGATARESGLEESDLFGYIFGNTSYEGSTLIKQKPETIDQTTYEFYLPNSLESVIINGTIIGNYDFNYCSTIKNVIIKGSVTNIGNCAFLYTGITNIIIPDSVTRIGGSAFSYCDDLKYVIMPDSVTTINSSAFGSNNKLTVYCEAASVQDGWVTGTYYTWVNSSIPVIYRTTGYGTTDGFIWVEANNEVILADYIGKDTSIEIPTKINGTPITTIARYAFDGCATLSSITMSNNIISIGEYAFQNVQNITNIVVPDSVKSIGIGAFKGCNKIENITLPFVGASADARNYNAVFGYIFGYTQVQAAYESGDPSNAYDNLNYGKAPSETIWQYSYKGVYSSYNEHRNYPTSVYYYIPTSIKNVTITTQTTLPVAAFNNCSFIETINLPMTMTKIGSYAFQKCTQLKHINIPIPVTSIDSYAFSGCSNLNAVYYGGTSSNWSGISISSNNSPLTSATCYYYSESQPTDEGNYWYYDKNKNIVVW